MRAFIAVYLNDELKDNISDFTEECRQKQERSVKYVSRENLHVTMKFLGDLDNGSVEKLSKDLEGVQSPPSDLRAEGAGAFPNVFFPNVLWVGIRDGGALGNLFYEIEDRAAALGVEKETKKFHPHVTIARLKGKADAGLVELVKNCRKYFGSFTAESFVLMKSELTPEGPVYTRLRSFPMRTRR